MSYPFANYHVYCTDDVRNACMVRDLLRGELNLPSDLVELIVRGDSTYPFRVYVPHENVVDAYDVLDKVECII